MAGFFGFFNYEKEGPGIEKNAPKKKAFIVFFETFFRNFWKFITINLVFSLISLPLITNGFAAVGMTNVTRNTARDKHSFGLSDFFETIKKNWKQALPAGIINAIVYIVLFIDTYFFFNLNGALATVGLGIILSFLLVFTLMNYFMWTMMITFKFTLKQIYMNSFKFAFINLFKNLGLILCLALTYALYIGIFILSLQLFASKGFLLVLTIEMILYVTTFPAFKFLLIQYFTFPAIKKYIIDPYYLEHPDEDIEKRRDLGISVEGYDDEDTSEEENDDQDGDDDELVFDD